MTTIRHLYIFLWFLFLSVPLLAQSKPQKADAPQWPKLERKSGERVDQLCENLKRPDATLKKNAEQELTTLGAGAAPALIQKLSDFPNNINEPLYRVLDKITAPEHAPLVASYAREKRTAIRFWVAARLATFHDKAMEPILAEAMKDKDKETAYRAALGLVALGNVRALDAVLARCIEDWSEVGELSLLTISPGRSHELARILLDKLDKADTKLRICALRLLRSLGTKEDASMIKVYLDSEDHAVKKEAINALRVIVDNQPALETLSVFDEIEMANEWKKKG